MKMVAALYVASNGCYFGLPNVDPWDKRRDARAYAGPHPVVAHPPCERWGRYWGGAPSTFPRLKLGDDNGCFAAAIDAVDADRAEPGYKGIGYDEREHISLAAAVRWAQGFDHAVTLYLYDEDSGIYPIDHHNPHLAALSAGKGTET